MAALGRYLASGEAVAFLGAGASMPLYPLWATVITELVDAAAERGLGADKAATCRALASEQPDAVVELLRRHLGPAQYQAALREAFGVRRDPESQDPSSGRSGSRRGGVGLWRCWWRRRVGAC